MNKLSGLLVGLASALIGWQIDQPARAATSYPITGIQVVSAKTYQTANLTGVGYHITVQRHQRAQLRVNLHLKYHQQTRWVRQEQADLIQHGQRVRYYLVKNDQHESGWVRARDLKPTPATSVHLNVPLISQLPELPSGCEMTATTMMLQYAGVRVNKQRFAATVPRTNDPQTGFVGDPASSTGVWLYVYPQGLLNPVRRYLPTAVDLSGVTLAALKAKVATKRPVVVWVVGLDGFASHTITVTGYTPTTISYNDPWTGRAAVMANAEFEAMWARNGRRALSY